MEAIATRHRGYATLMRYTAAVGICPFVRRRPIYGDVSSAYITFVLTFPHFSA
jgi:hypothetical protein